jgi:5-methylcytosine-specific restriction endonuclease McrA
MKICEYGCGQEAKHQFKNGKWCCEKDWRRCPEKLLESRELKKGKSHPMYGIQKSRETREKISKARKGQPSPRKGKTHTLESRKKMSESMQGRKPWNKGKVGYLKHSKDTKKKMSISSKLSIIQIKKQYPFFSQIEEMRYNPNKPGEKEIQVHCKNHLCENSKERGGWFTPTFQQMKARKDWLEKEGRDLCYFYCSEKCREICPLYRLRSDPLKENKNLYTQEEYQQFRNYVLKRDNYECQYCGEKATEIHHERPQKLEPLFVLDPDFAWSCCEECHYKYGHKTGTECSTGNLANKIC